MRTRYRITDPHGIYFVTSTIIDWIPLLAGREHAEIIVDALKHCQAVKGLRIYSYVIMHHHFHLIASASQLSATMQSLKRHTARQIVRSLERRNDRRILSQLLRSKKRHKGTSTYQVWQEGFHPELIQTESMLRQKVKYIHYNPVKSGYVDQPEEWRYSSARNFPPGNQSEIVLDDVWLEGPDST